MSLKGAFENNGLFRKIIFTIVFSFSLFAFCLLLWYIGVYLIYQPTEFEEFIRIIGMGNSSLLKSLQIVQSFGFFIIPPFILAYLWSRNTISYLQLNKFFSVKTMGYTIIAMIVVIPFINLISELNQNMVLPHFMKSVENWMKINEEKASGVLETFLAVNTWGGLAFNIFLMGVLPAVGEELFFRGILQRIISEKWGKHWGVWITAFIFSAIHFQFFGFLPRFLLGAFLGYLLAWSGSLWLPIIAHFINNSLAVVFYFLKNKGYIQFDIDTIGTTENQWIGLVSLALFVGVIFFLFRSFHSKKL